MEENTSPQSVITEQPIEQTTKTNSKIKWTLFIILLILLLLFSIFCIYLLNNNKTVKKPTTKITSTINLAKPTPAIKKTNTWQQYIAKDGAYEIMYPPVDDWAVYVGPVYDAFANGKLSVRIHCDTTTICKSLIKSLVITEVPYNTIGEYIKNSENILDHKDIILNGSNAEEAYITNSKITTPMHYTPVQYQVFVPVKTNGYLLTYGQEIYVTKNGEHYIPTSDYSNLTPDLISTFKLLPYNQNNSIFTFFNAKYGYSFNYPKNDSINIINDKMVGLDNLGIYHVFPNSEDNKLSFLDFASNQALSSHYASGPNGESYFDKIIKSAPFTNPNGITGYKFYMHWVAKASGKTEEVDETQPLIIIDVSKQTNNALKAIIIDGISDPNVNNILNPEVDNITNSFGFK